jgi:hypothetical protein
MKPTMLPDDVGNMCPNFLTFHHPNVTLNLIDNALFFWMECPSTVDNGLNLSFEIGLNYEAVPFPQNDFLFDRQLVVGSEDDLAAAAEVMALSGNPSSATASSLGSAESGRRPKVSKLSNVKAMTQKSSVLKVGGARSPGTMLSALDLSNHQISVAMQSQELSPLHNVSTRGVSLRNFLLLLLKSLEDKSEQKESSPAYAGAAPLVSQKLSAVVSSVASTPGASAFAQRATSSLGGEPDWSYVRSRLTITDPTLAPQK